MNLWRKPCEHGRYDAHFKYVTPIGAIWFGKEPPPDQCPGGSPVTEADLERVTVDALAKLALIEAVADHAPNCRSCVSATIRNVLAALTDTEGE